MRWKIVVIGLAAALALGGRVTAARSVAVSDPSGGERLLGQTVIEPAYDDGSGEVIYLMTPIGAPIPSKSNSNAVSPLYLVVYPNSAAPFVGPMNCAHQPNDDCPTHGPGTSIDSALAIPSVYGPPDGSGVWGHDHLVDAPGGREFNVAWEVVVILFTSSVAARPHITTDAQIDAFVDSGRAIRIDTGFVFNCNVVSAATYRRATPLPPVLPLPLQLQRP